jgi:hypothetical protein
MSLLNHLQNPYEDATYIVFGDNQIAVKYTISDATLTAANYEPIYGAIITHTTEAPVPQGLYAVSEKPQHISDNSFYWRSPDNGHVTWVCIGVPPEPPVSIPEPSAKSYCILAVLLLAVVLVIRGLGSNRGWAK